MPPLRLRALALSLVALASSCSSGDDAPRGRAPISSLELLTSHPVVSHELGLAERRPAVAMPGGFRIDGPDSGTPFRPLAPPLRAEVSGDSGALALVTEQHRIVVHRRGVVAEAPRLHHGAVLHDGGTTSVAALTFARGTAIEDLFVAPRPGLSLGYDVTLPEGLRFVAIDDDTIEVVDDDAGSVLRVSSPAAWDRDGDPVDVALRLDGAGIAVVAEVSPDDYPVIVDPTWADATVPLKLRTRHTATLLGDGRVLLVGGRTGAGPDASAELYDPRTGASSFVGAMASARAEHTATLLRDGRVLVTGGNDGAGPVATTELYDPVTRSFSAGPDMSAARATHAATMLDDGRVLLVGHGASGAEVFDPATGTLSSTASPPPDATAIASALLDDGRVLVVGGGNTVWASVFDPAGGGGVGTFSATGAPTTFGPGQHSLTRMRDGRVLVLGGCPCASVGGPSFYAPQAEVWDPTAAGGVGAFSPTGDQNQARLGHTATLLPDGKVLVTGGENAVLSVEQLSAELYDPSAGTFALVPGSMSDARGGHTATLMPSGDVLLVGGTQASAELYVGAGAGAATFVAGPNLVVGRAYHAVTPLSDGRLLVTGGKVFQEPGEEDIDAEIFDPATGTSTATGPMVVTRFDHTATRLRDGRVLVAGGTDGLANLASLELFDPAGAGAFTAAGSLGAARAHHTATLLPDGKVLLAGGVGATSSAELYDPATGAVSPTSGAMLQPMSRHAATLLPNGKVLLVGGSVAQLYDPATDAFETTGQPGTSRTEVELAVLPSGEVFVSGGKTLSAELYDPASGTFAFTSASGTERVGHRATLLPTGSVLVSGGQNLAAVTTVFSSTEVFERASGPTGGFYAASSLLEALTAHTSTLLPSGEVLVTGGESCNTICIDFPHDQTRLFRPSFHASPYRPLVSASPPTAVAGASLTIGGSGFSGPEASGGNSNNSASNHPLVFWSPLEGGVVLQGIVTSWDDGSLEAVLPATAYLGPGWLRVAVNGMTSRAVPLELTAAQLAAVCAYDAECESGSCVDGVCCDAACDGPCQACTAALKGSGADGICDAVPAELDPEDDCEVSVGAPCVTGAQCATGFCADGVCCQSACTAQCEACDVEGSVGTCVPVSGAPHGDRASCNPQPVADLCAALVCDGIDRESCAGMVGPCDPYACGPEACLDACVTDAECAVGYHCDAGTCVAGRCEGAKATTAEGEVIDCSPYVCQADGSCRTSCADVSDCAKPFACDFDGRCVARPPADRTGACDCQGAPGAPPRGAVGAGLALLAVVLARRRRRVAALSVGLALLCSGAVAQAAPSDPAPTAPSSAAPPAAPSSAAPPAAPAAPDPEAAKAEARARFERGLGLVKDQAWAPALAEFMESRRLHATRSATQNAAFCLRKLDRLDEALETYEALLREFPDVDEAKKLEAQVAITELRSLVGTIEIDAAEPGATIVVDGRARGTYPPTAPLRVGAGTHVVRVFKQGYEPFEARVDVAGRGVARVEAKLVQLKDSGKLKVTEASGKTLVVVVDQVEVGTTPFEGALAVGKHVVTLRGEEGLGVPPTAAPIERDRTTSLELSAVKLDASLRVEPTPAAGLVTIDDVEVGRGTWEGRLPSGRHVVTVSADGFLPVRREVEAVADEPSTLRVELARDEDDERWALPAKITLEVSGAVNLFPSTFGGTTQGCDDACSSGLGLGGLAFVHLAYELGVGLGFGLSGGYFAATHAVEGRTASVQPVGLPARDGRVDDRVSVIGGLVGAHVAYHFGEVAPVLLRLGAGALLGETRDERVGSFPLDDGFTYQAGPVVQSPFSAFVYVDPEVRVAYQLAEGLEVSAGVQALLLVALGRARWDANDEVDAAVDGIGAFGGEDLTGPVWFVIAPGLGARYVF